MVGPSEIRVVRTAQRPQQATEAGYALGVALGLVEGGRVRLHNLTGLG
jgi:hypothetical protein